MAPQTAQVHPANASDGLRGGTSPGVWKHGNDTPNRVQLVDFKQDGGTAPTPGYDDPFNPRSTQAPSQVGPFPVPPQVAAAAPKQPPPQAPPSPSAPAPSGLAGPGFGQCVGEQFKDNIGKNMVKNGFENAVETGIEGAIGGAAVSAIVSPEAGGLGALPGAVLGFVGGFGKGLLVDAPIETAADAVGECNK